MNQITSLGERIAHLKQSISLRGYVAQDLNHVPARHRTNFDVYQSPFRAPERTPSLAVWDVCFKDYGAEEYRGDLINWVMLRLNSTSRGEAVEYLEGGKLTLPKPEFQPTEREQKDLQPARNRFHNDLPLALDFFQQRGISKSTAFDFTLGVALKFPHTYRFTNGAEHRFFCKRYAIPTIVAGKVWAINMRLDADAATEAFLDVATNQPALMMKLYGDQNKKGNSTDEQLIQEMFGDKYVMVSGSLRYPFNLESIVRFDKERKPEPFRTSYALLNAERKELDVLAATSAGYIACGFPAEWAISKTSTVKHLCSGIQNPIIIADNDGGTGLEKAKKLLDAIGNPNAKILLPPEPFKDLSDMVTAGALESWLKGYGISPVPHKKVA